MLRVLQLMGLQEQSPHIVHPRPAKVVLGRGVYHPGQIIYQVPDSVFLVAQSAFFSWSKLFRFSN